MDFDVRAELAQILREVVSKRIVVVEQQNHVPVLVREMVRQILRFAPSRVMEHNISPEPCQEGGYVLSPSLRCLQRGQPSPGPAYALLISALRSGIRTSSA